MTLALAVCGILILPLAAADEDEELLNLAAELAKKRSEVETLSTELELKKSQLRDQLQSLSSQKTELEVQIKKEEMRLSRIDQDLRKHRERVTRKQVSNDVLKPVVLEHVTALKTYVESALPFKLSERISEIDKLGEMLMTDKIEPEKALARLWTLVEAELRLTHENGLYRQNILLNNENQLAHVAKLGMVFLYFKSFDGLVGKAIQTEDGWEYRIVEERDDRKRILYLFDSMEKHIREGYFELPNPS